MPVDYVVLGRLLHMFTYSLYGKASSQEKTVTQVINTVELKTI